MSVAPPRVSPITWCRSWPRPNAPGATSSVIVLMEQWSYATVVIGNTDVSKAKMAPGAQLTERLNQMGADGWELVTSLTTVKTMLNLTGNELVFVFKKPGIGHTPPPVDVGPAY